MKGFRKQKKQSNKDQVKQFSAFMNKFNELKSKDLTLDQLRELYETEKPGGMYKLAFIECSKVIADKMMKEQMKKEAEEYNQKMKEESKSVDSEDSTSEVDDKQNESNESDSI